MQAIENVLSIGTKYPITSSKEIYDCICLSPYDKSDFSWTKYTSAQCSVSKSFDQSFNN